MTRPAFTSPSARTPTTRWNGRRKSSAACACCAPAATATRWKTGRKPINPALLDALTKDFIDHKFDARHLMKQIVTSATYQRSSVPNTSNKHDEQNFSHAIPRRIPAEALLDSLIQATGVPENFGGAPA